MRKMPLLYFMVTTLAYAVQRPDLKPVSEQDIRDALEFIAVVVPDNETDPEYFKNRGSLSDDFKALVRRGEESGISQRRILEIAMEEADRYANLVDGSGHKSFAFNSVRILSFVAESGDRSLLPYLEEKSLDPETPKSIRSTAAEAYVDIADVEESAEFMRKLYRDPSAQGSGRYFLNKKFLGRVGAEEKTLTPETKKSIAAFLLGIVQNVENSGEANDADRFLLDRIPEYANSRQRATLCRFANTGNAWVTNTYNPIKAHFDTIPQKQRIDLRKRFPDLPPLPDDAPVGNRGVKAALAIGAGVAAVVAARLVLRRKKAHEAA